MYVTDEWVRTVTGRHRTTVTRWRQRNAWPRELKLLARLMLDGELELVHPKWAGWTLDRKTGELASPGGDTYMPGEVLATTLRVQQVNELKRQLKALTPDTRSLIQRLADALRQGARRATSVDPRPGSTRDRRLDER